MRVFLLLSMMVLYPVSQIILSMSSRIYPSRETVEAGLASIRAYTSAAQPCGEILFIDQRQLLTFGYVPGIALVPEYEKKLMMDKAMAEDAAYFEPFYQDLADRRFALIIVEPLRTEYQGNDYEFGNENDAWVKWVSRPILRNYHEVDTHLSLGFQVLAPTPGETSGADSPQSCQGIP